MEAAARDPGYRPDPPSSPRHPGPAGNQPVGKPAAQRTPGADVESPPPARRPGRDPRHIAPNNGIPVSPALPPPCNAMPPMRRPQMPKDTAQTTPRGLAAERPDEGANGDENHNVNDPSSNHPTTPSPRSPRTPTWPGCWRTCWRWTTPSTSAPPTTPRDHAPRVGPPHRLRAPGGRPGAPSAMSGPLPPRPPARPARRLLRYAPPRRGAGRDDDSDDIGPETPADTAEGSRRSEARRR